MGNPKFKERNAIYTLYSEKYELDKQFSFRWPRLKDDLEAYLNAILVSVDNAFNEAQVPKIKGHEGLVYVGQKKNPDKGNGEE